jgi:hypothetical protein
MRTTTAFATFLALAAGTTGVSAADFFMRGSDTLKLITENVVSTCPGVPGVTGDQIVYNGTGSGNGENDLRDGIARIAPMSRALGAGVCTFGDPDNASEAEGIAFALDGLSVVADADDVGTCNTADGDCNRLTGGTTGLAYSRTITDGTTSYTYGAGAIGAANAWRDVLRVVYAGMEQGDGNTIANRDCNGAVRRLIVNNWGNLFENSGCTAGNCTQLRHAFRRDEESGTTDVFVSLLNLPSFVFAPAASQRSPFCNARTTATNGTEPAAPNSPPYHMEFQDNDPIRRTCLGTFNLPLTAGAEPPPDCTTPFSPNVPGKCAVYSGTEQVCNKDGTLGIVLPINPPPSTSATSTNPYSLSNPADPTSAPKVCSRGKFIFGQAPGKASAGTPSGPSDYCPNGDTPFFVNRCFVPAATDNDSNCLNGRNNLPAFEFNSTLANAIDGRVYNLTLRNTPGGDIARIKRPNATTLGGAPLEAQIIGAFYRLHVSRSGRSVAHDGASSNPVPAAVFENCREENATKQIGCLVTRNQCSIGYAGREAADATFGSVSVQVDAVPPTDECVRNLITNPGQKYQIARKLYLNTAQGFENIDSVDDAGDADNNDVRQYRMAGCFADRAFIEPLVTAHGFIPLSGPGAPMSPFCEEFAQETTCNPAQPAGTPACGTSGVFPFAN